MDVKLPDGTIIKDVPDGTTQTQLILLLEKNGYDVAPLRKAYTESLIKTTKDQGFGSGIPKLAYDLGGKVTDHAVERGTKPGFAAAQGYLANILTQALPAAATSAQTPASLLGGPARWLMQTSVKPSSTLPPHKVKEAMGTMLEEGIYPTMSGMDKATKIVGGIDDTVEQILRNSPGQVNVAKVGSYLREPFEHAKTQVNPKADMAAVRAAWDEFKESPLVMGKTEIPVLTAHEIKKGTYRALGKKSYNEIGSSSTEAQKALASGARAEVAAAEPQVADLLSRQSGLMNVKEVAAPRALIESNKNPLGLTGLRLDHPTSAAAFWADRYAALKAFIAMQMNALGKPGILAPAAVTADNPNVRGYLAP